MTSSNVSFDRTHLVPAASRQGWSGENNVLQTFTVATARQNVLVRLSNWEYFIDLSKYYGLFLVALLLLLVFAVCCPYATCSCCDNVVCAADRFKRRRDRHKYSSGPLRKMTPDTKISTAAFHHRNRWSTTSRKRTTADDYGGNNLFIRDRHYRTIGTTCTSEHVELCAVLPSDSTQTPGEWNGGVVAITCTSNTISATDDVGGSEEPVTVVNYESPPPRYATFSAAWELMRDIDDDCDITVLADNGRSDRASIC